jgi:hypothetical protein
LLRADGRCDDQDAKGGGDHQAPPPDQHAGRRRYWVGLGRRLRASAAHSGGTPRTPRKMRTRDIAPPGR